MRLQRVVSAIDERSGASPLFVKALRYLFPDHWSFLLGEVALYAFMVLVGTGIYLTLFFEPSLGQTTYHGTYAPLQGAHMSEAYKSAIDISFRYKAGLLMRQTHHWAADVFVAAIVVHLMRVFFTGAFRKPRELTWVVGLAILFSALLEGYLGYSMVDDLLSGMGLAIGYGVALSLPVIGGNLGVGLWGSPFPGDHAFESRMYIGHVLIFPVLIGLLIGLHLTLVAARHHTQFAKRPRQTNRRLVGVPAFPGQAPRSLALLLAVAAVLFALGGLVQINPIWQWGPYETSLGTNGAQPDWYLGWLIGALRLMPGFDVTIGDYTLIPNPFWGGVLFPIVVLGVLVAVPWAERRLTGDRGVHNLADRPRDAPRRTAFGVAFLTWVGLIFFAGSADRLYVFLGVSYESMIWIYRAVTVAVPIGLFLVVLAVCRQLQEGDRQQADRERAEREAEDAEREAGRGLQLDGGEPPRAPAAGP
ncbi:ubiquinol-cytochrome c reductase cytochrome b subunit [Baekduia soli]|uniref:Cytochrome bc1 complex cytochrome b subunit n=1 Tax=Baekduia soli TaxID=496014 RepID=A0A5B8U6D7_9ACTN|nr:cytochrome b N-terminal domain-containing protein [Baekduia soli]QEC48222.1 ubiquinol-cytochrome c reductase cytochrome b subunit [Baekduia soli]